jgi:hypothetical protein
MSRCGAPDFLLAWPVRRLAGLIAVVAPHREVAWEGTAHLVAQCAMPIASCLAGHGFVALAAQVRRNICRMPPSSPPPTLPPILLAPP